MRQEFNTHWNRIHSTPEINSGEKIVETAGYISRKKRIEALMLAGERLASYRKEMYDTDKPDVDPDEIPLDPMRSKSFDLADASEGLALAKGALNKLKKIKEGLKTDPQTAQEGSGEQKNASPDPKDGEGAI